MLFGDGPKWNEFAKAGVGEDNIDSPVHARNGLVKTIKVSRLGDISLNTRNVGADCLDGLVKLLLAAARDKDIGALFDEKLRRSQPNPFCAAGDDGGLACEFFGHCLSLAPFRKKSMVTGSLPFFRHAWRVPFCTTTSPRFKSRVSQSSNSSQISPS